MICMTDQAVDIQVAEAVLSELNLAPAGTFVRPFTAERVYLGTPDLADVAGVRLSITPTAVDDEFAARAGVTSEVVIQIGVRAKLQNSPGEPAFYLAEMDELRLLTQQVRRFLCQPQRRRLSALPAAMLTRGPQNNPTFAPEHLGELGQYTSIITLTYRVTGQEQP
jgi:hypothetical protein